MDVIDSAAGDRRRKVRLRQIISEARGVADSAVEMAAAIEASIPTLPSADVVTASEELVSLRLLASDMERLVVEVLDRERRLGFVAL